ncbi:MAG: FecR family protein [Saprospiraceae bacterium]
MTSKEKKGLGQWLDRHADEAGETGLIKRIWEATGSYKSGYQPDVDKAFARFKAKAGMSEGVVASLSPRHTWMKIAAAAAIFVFAIFLFKNLMDAVVEMETITAEAGVQKSFLLSDGSSVSLNENTKLEYPNQFSGAERRVKLAGEAFFQVAKDAAHPFIVETSQVEVQVLGTSFNVREYPDEKVTEVFVKTGKVSVTLKTSGEQHILLPGEKLTFETAESKVVKTIDAPANSMAWKSGRLLFDEKPMAEILSAVERLHHVHFTFEDDQLSDCSFNITLDASGLKGVLHSFEVACPSINIRPSGSGVFAVSGKCCE